MQFVSNEFFYSSDKFCGKENYDFSDDGIISPKERFEFLSHYTDFLKKTYNISNAPQMALSEEDALSELNCTLLTEPMPKTTKRIVFSKMKAHLEDAETHLGWNLYTPSAVIENGSVVFKANPLPPTPNAVYKFESDSFVTEFSFKFCIGSEYKAPIHAILDNTPAREIALRSGICDVLALRLYPNGEVYANVSDKCPYHGDFEFIGKYIYDEQNEISIKLSKENFTVTLNGSESKALNYTGALNPDLIFIGSGMFHLGQWSVTPISLKTETETITDFFAKKSAESIRTDLGEVCLPYRVGGFENRDKMLVFESVFIAQKCQKAILDVSSLDPHGDVYINGELVLKTKGFEQNKIDVVPYLKEGENHLKIAVYPRAPELLFTWHRQKDAYNGWFCEKVTLTFINECEVSDIFVKTLDVSNEKIKAEISAKVENADSAQISISKIFPKCEKESVLGTYSVKNGEVRETLEIDAEKWDIDCPVLYCVRVSALSDGKVLDDEVCETGFRTIEQKNGKILLNGSPIVLTGALLMQFLPPYSETPVTHICPRDEQIWQQEKLVKLMGGNTLRSHILRYGSNDERYARYADRMGLLLIWTTRFIDSVEQLEFEEKWSAKDEYLKQIFERRNHPSIIMWEGANEYHPTLDDIDRIYSQFVPAIKSIDDTRLLSPISHLYYAADSYPIEGCGYYDDNGTHDHDGNERLAAPEWNDPLVVRSAHTYEILLGYGTGWERMRTQCWSMQPQMLNSKDFAYIVSEFAIIGRQNPYVPEAEEYFNEYSYEFPNEDALGFRFTREQWQESQAYQALCAKVTTQIMQINGVDGMLWCCLMGGANDGGYLKPPIDCYGYPKYAFHTLKEGYQQKLAVSTSVDVLKQRDFTVTPKIISMAEGEVFDLTAELLSESGEVLKAQTYTNVGSGEVDSFSVHTQADGYYSIRYTLTQK